MLEGQGELASFRRFQAMPQHRGSAAPAQLRRFLGTRATRRIRGAGLLAAWMDPARLPDPLDQLAARLRAAAAPAQPGADGRPAPAAR